MYIRKLGVLFSEQLFCDDVFTWLQMNNEFDQSEVSRQNTHIFFFNVLFFLHLFLSFFFGSEKNSMQSKTTLLFSLEF